MLEKIDLNKKLSKKEYEIVMDELAPKLALLQRECKAAEIPIMVLFEGWGASGKGTLINKLIAPLDPRGFKVFTIQKVSEEEAMRPFLWRFWTKLPAKGRIHIFDRSWYRSVVANSIDTSGKENEKARLLSEINQFEQELVEDGMIIIKFFLHISQKVQKSRFKGLEKTKKTSWRVTSQDWKQNESYDKYRNLFDEMIAKTDTEYAPWTIIEATDKEFATSKIIATMVEKLQDAKKKKEEALYQKEISKQDDQVESNEKKQNNEKEVPIIRTESKAYLEIEKALKLDVLSGVDLSLTLGKENYKKRVIELQEKLAILHYEM